MAEISFLLELVCWRLGAIGTMYGQKSLGRLRLPLLGCAVSLVVGCGTLPPQQATTMIDPAPPKQPAKTPMATPPEAQATNPATGSPKWELPIPDHPAVETWVQRFSQEKHKSFQSQLERARHYVARAQEIFEQAGLPKDLVYVALVESGFSPTARSSANAVGMWQFISSTGKRFGLDQNEWIDERRHPFKAAQAAADYLSFLYDAFGSWDLALAAYNAGENGVQGALDQSGLTTFWELAENGRLPAETRDYVPKVFAAVKIIRNFRDYGFHFDPQQYTPRHETVSVPGGVQLTWLGKKTGISELTLRDHNPELIRSLTPPGCPDYELCVPIGTGESVLTALAERLLPNGKPAKEIVEASSNPTQTERGLIAPKKTDSRPPLKASGDKLRGKEGGGAEKSTTASATSYTIRAGDTWFSLAKKYGCSPSELATLNGMKTSQPLKVGRTLRVLAKDSVAVATAKKGSGQKGKAPDLAGQSPAGSARKSCRPVYYPVRQGDTLWSIAERFRVTIDKLCAHNKLDRSQKLIPGNVLIICTAEQEPAYAAKRRSN
jgi:membrane-bound lytic murein transglycosylase D